MDTIPFETLLYLCHGAFAFIDNGFFERTSKTGCLLLYVLAMVIVTVYCCYAFIKKIYDKNYSGLFVFFF